MLVGAQVYKGIWQQNTPVAVKFVTGHSPKEQQRFRNEVAILKSLRHVNIVQFLGASMAGDQIMLVTEYMPRGDLWRALSQDSTHHFAWRNMCARPRLSSQLLIACQELIGLSLHISFMCRSGPQKPHCIPLDSVIC